MRDKITLACTECKQRNYDSKKNKKNDPDRIEIKKFCKFCKKQMLKMAMFFCIPNTELSQKTTGEQNGQLE